MKNTARRLKRTWGLTVGLVAFVLLCALGILTPSAMGAGAPAIAMEVLYASTDPLVKLFRKIIPTVRLGGVGFDLSIVVLLIGVWILLTVVERLALTSAL